MKIVSNKFEHLLEHSLKRAYNDALNGKPLKSKEIIKELKENFKNSLIEFDNLSFNGVFVVKPRFENRYIKIPNSTKKVLSKGKRYKINFTKAFNKRIKNAITD